MIEIPIQIICANYFFNVMTLATDFLLFNFFLRRIFPPSWIFSLISSQNVFLLEILIHYINFNTNFHLYFHFNPSISTPSNFLSITFSFELISRHEHFEISSSIIKLYIFHRVPQSFPIKQRWSFWKLGQDGSREEEYL